MITKHYRKFYSISHKQHKRETEFLFSSVEDIVSVGDKSLSFHHDVITKESSPKSIVLILWIKLNFHCKLITPRAPEYHRQQQTTETAVNSPYIFYNLKYNVFISLLM